MDIVKALSNSEIRQVALRKSSEDQKRLVEFAEAMKKSGYDKTLRWLSLEESAKRTCEEDS